MRLGEKGYRLVNITVTETADDNKSFYADIAGALGDSKECEIIGTILVTIKDYEGFRIGEGTLTMNEGDYSGNYTVLLHIPASLPGAWWRQDES